LVINLLLWFCVPAWGQNFLWLSGSTNYLWTTTILLFFLIPFRKKHDDSAYKLNLPLSCLFLLCGFLAGGTNENSGAAVLILLIAYYIMKVFDKNKTKDKIALFEIMGTIGFLLGFILLVAAPGNAVRMEVIRQLGWGYVGEPLLVAIIKRFIDITLMLINNGWIPVSVTLLLGIDLVKHQKQKLNLFTCFYALAGLASMYSMLLSPSFPDRSFMIVVVFCCIVLGNLLVQMKFELPGIIKRNIYLCSILLVIGLSYSFMSASKNIVGIYLKWQKRIVYINEEKEKGNLDVEFKEIHPKDKHAALYGLEDIAESKTGWTNAAIANYYGLNSIKGVYNDVPWDDKISDIYHYLISPLIKSQ
jgi:hypothetical protein